MAKERIMHMQKNENLIEVYKKKIETNAQLQQDLAEYQGRTQTLLDDIELLKGERENNRQLKECVAFLES